MTNQAPIDRFEGFPVSDMAKNRAVRSVQEVIDSDSFIERVTGLVMSANNGADIAEGYEGDLMDVFSPAFKHGIRVAIRTLAAAGLAEADVPVDGLVNMALQMNLLSSLALEQSYPGDLKKLYLPIDGGNEE